MNFADRLRWAWRALSASRSRSWLTAVGIAIGIAAVTLLTGLGEGVRHYVIQEFSQFGSRILAISPGKTETWGMGGLLNATRPLTLDDAQALARLPHVEYMVPVVQGNAEAKWRQRSRHVDVLGVNADMPAAWHFAVARGRFLPDTEGRSPQVAVIGHKVWTALFQRNNPLGEWLRLGGQRFRVIGVIAPKGDMLGYDLDDVVYIPTDQALSLFNREGLMEIDLVFSPAITATELEARVRDLIRKRHGFDDVTVISQDQMLGTLDRVTRALTLIVALLGGISLLVGAVGIYTILTTSITERYAEIGLLRALGAGRSQILILFLTESVLLALWGGSAGILFAFMLTAGIRLGWPDFPLHLQWPYLLLSLVVAALTGILSGVRPAWRASRLSPVEALRGE